MEVIISAILGIMIGIIITRLKTSSEMASLKCEREYYEKKFTNEKIKTEARDIFIRDLLKKESVKTNKSTTNS